MDFFGKLQWNDNSDTDYGFDTSGEPTTGIFPWRDNQPSSDNEECVQVWPASSTNYGWNDLSCEYSCYPLCAGDGTGDVIFSRMEDPLTVDEGQLVTYIDITDEMHFEMDITVNTFPSSWFVYLICVLYSLICIIREY